MGIIVWGGVCVCGPAGTRIVQRTESCVFVALKLFDCTLK